MNKAILLSLGVFMGYGLAIQSNPSTLTTLKSLQSTDSLLSNSFQKLSSGTTLSATQSPTSTLIGSFPLESLSLPQTLSTPTDQLFMYSFYSFKELIDSLMERISALEQRIQNLLANNNANILNNQSSVTLTDENGNPIPSASPLSKEDEARMQALMQLENRTSDQEAELNAIMLKTLPFDPSNMFGADGMPQGLPSLDQATLSGGESQFPGNANFNPFVGASDGMTIPNQSGASQFPGNTIPDGFDPASMVAPGGFPTFPQS